MTAAINSRLPVFAPHAEDGAAAAPPPRKSSSAVQPNQVEAWSGTVPLGQARRSAAEVNGQLDRLMMKDSPAPVRDLFVTERNAREAVALLEQLPAPEYQRALATMRHTTLDQLVREMDPDTRSRFLEQARNKGALTEEPGVRAPPREGSPPDKPALLRNERSLPVALRTAIHAENKARAHQYLREFDGYVSRYSEAALHASSPLALRMIGPPATEFVLLEPGVLGNDRVVPSGLMQGSTDRARAARAVNDRISDFAGRTRAGSYSATFEAAVSADLQGHGGKANYSAKLTDYGKLDQKVRGEAELAVVKGLSIGVTSEGKRYQELHAGSLRLRSEGGKLSELEGKISGVGVSLTQEKTTFSLGGSETAPVGVFAAIDEKQGSYGGGVKVGGKQELGTLGAIEATLKVGFTAQGVAPERLPDIASMVNDGIWGPMPELSGNVRWEQLPAARRDRLARDGWSLSNWPVR